MVGKVFKNTGRAAVPPTDTRNLAGGEAYSFSPKHRLAQAVVTGCFSDTFYADAEMQVADVLDAAAAVPPKFLAKAAIYGREKGYMKDAPAVLLAALVHRKRDGGLTTGIEDYPAYCFQRAFPRVVDNGRMLRNFVQVLRSGAIGGKKAIPRPVRRLIVDWLEKAKPESLFRWSVGNQPSLADVIRMVHPKPKTIERSALMAYLIGRPSDERYAMLPEVVRDYERWKKAPEEYPVPRVPFQMLDAVPLPDSVWMAIAGQAGWQETRMSLRTFERHGVLKDREVVKMLAARLRDPDSIRKARAFPYQILMAFEMTRDLPRPIGEALQDALDVAVENVPPMGKVLVFPDISGSMSHPVTGLRKGATTAVRCQQVAGLMAAAVLRVNRDARVIPFGTGAYRVHLNPRDSVASISEKIASMDGGGTCCEAPLAMANAEGETADVVIYVSDNESWLGTHGPGTGVMRQWAEFKRRSPSAKLVCIDLTPNATSQAPCRRDVLNVGGFGDNVWPVVDAFVKGGDWPAASFVDAVEAVTL